MNARVVAVKRDIIAPLMGEMDSVWNVHHVHRIATDTIVTLIAPNVSREWTRAHLNARHQNTSASGYVLEGKVAKGMKEAMRHASETPKLSFDEKILLLCYVITKFI